MMSETVIKSLRYTLWGSNFLSVITDNLDLSHRWSYSKDHGLYTAISRKVVGQNVHAAILKGNMGYGQYTVPDTVAVKPTSASHVILSNFFE